MSAFVDRTVVPCSPTATAVELSENDSAKIFWAAGLNAVNELPPLPVLSTRSPLSVAMMQVEFVAQRIDIRSVDGIESGTGLGVQVSPPSLVFSTVFAAPTA